MASDRGESVDLPSISGRVTKWASGRVSLSVDQMNRKRGVFRQRGLSIEIEIAPADATRMAALLNTEVLE